MEDQIRLLCIVPYEGIKTLLTGLAEEYPQVKMDIFVGNMDEGIKIAREKSPEQYDAVISRGGTAKILRRIPLPVVEIEISLYDILRALRLSGGLRGKLAMVAYANIAVSTRALCDLLGYQIEIFTVKSLDELEPTLRRLREAQYDAVLCDMTADTIARSLGLNTIFITSGLESVRGALDRAVALCHGLERLRGENRLFRELLEGQVHQTAVFNRRGDLAFSSTGTLSPALLDLLRRELEEPGEENERRVTRGVNGALYSLRIRPVEAGTAIYYTARETPFDRGGDGIRFYSRREAEAQAYGGTFLLRDICGVPGDELKLLAAGTAPVILTGEDGTHMGRAAAILFVQGPPEGAPLVSVNCGLMSEKGWEFLLEGSGSPLAEAGSVLYFSHADALPAKRRLQLKETLAEVCRHSRVMLSFVCGPGEETSPEAAEFLNRLNGRILYLRPLRSLSGLIPAQINSVLSRLNASRPSPVLGAEPEAVRLLQSFGWPYNYAQFQRVVEDLAASSQRLITAERVRQVLRREQPGFARASQGAAPGEPLDLSRTLDEISQDVARRVLAETGGNQSAAAKRLGISRTTLRRLVNAQ